MPEIPEPISPVIGKKLRELDRRIDVIHDQLFAQRQLNTKLILVLAEMDKLLTIQLASLQSVAFPNMN